MRAAGTTPTPPEATHHPHNQPPTHQNSLQAALSEETCRIEARRTTVNVQQFGPIRAPQFHPLEGQLLRFRLNGFLTGSMLFATARDPQMGICVRHGELLPTPFRTSEVGTGAGQTIRLSSTSA